MLLTVLTDKNCSETLESLDAGGGWEYVLYLHQYLSMNNDIKTAWDLHQYDEGNKNSKR